MERISKACLERDLYADMIDCFLHGSKEEYEAAERRYYRLIGAQLK